MKTNISFFKKILFAAFILSFVAPNALAQQDKIKYIPHKESDDFVWTRIQNYNKIETKSKKIKIFNIQGAMVNGKMVVPDDYFSVEYRNGYFQAWKQKQFEDNNKDLRGVPCDVYSTDGRLVYPASAGCRNIWYIKEINTHLFQFSDFSWYEEKTGRFIYRGGWDYTFKPDKYVGELQSVSTLVKDKYVCLEISDQGKDVRTLIYTTKGEYVCTVKRPSTLFKDRIDIVYIPELGFFSRPSGELDVFYDTSGIKCFIGKYLGNSDDIDGRSYYSLTHVSNGHNYACFYEKSNFSELHLVSSMTDKNITRAQGYNSLRKIIFKSADGLLYDETGKHLGHYDENYLPGEKEIIGTMGDEILYRTGNGSKLGISTFSGTEILAPEFNSVKYLGDNLFAFSMGGNWGVLRHGKTNQVIIPLSRSYTSIEYSRTLNEFTFEKAGNYQGTCNAKGVQTSIKKVKPKGPQIEFVSTILSLGNIKHKNPQKCYFKFKNIGDEPLYLTRVRTSCGCLVADYPKEAIMPGKEGTITLVYSAETVGGFKKTISVVTNSIVQPRMVLSIKGYVVE